jgi:hypothetical protein
VVLQRSQGEVCLLPRFKLKHWRGTPAIVAMEGAPNGDLGFFVLDERLKFGGANSAVLFAWHFPLF